MSPVFPNSRASTGVNHVIFAVCLSALVMMTILLSPAIGSMLWAPVTTPDLQTIQIEDNSLDAKIVSQ